MQLLQSNSVQSNQVTELMPPAPPDVLVSAETSVEEAGGAGCRGQGGRNIPGGLVPSCIESLYDPERKENLKLLAQIERMREFLKSGNSVKVTIARKWVESNLDVVEPIQEHGVIVDVLVTDASISEPPPARAHTSRWVMFAITAVRITVGFRFVNGIRSL
jgi:hypothetical protein